MMKVYGAHKTLWHSTFKQEEKSCLKYTLCSWHFPVFPAQVKPQTHHRIHPQGQSMTRLHGEHLKTNPVRYWILLITDKNSKYVKKKTTNPPSFERRNACGIAGKNQRNCKHTRRRTIARNWKKNTCLSFLNYHCII